MADPISIAIVTALATASATRLGESLAEGTVNVFKSLYKAVNERFRSRPEAQHAMEELRLDPDDPEAREAATAYLEWAAGEDPRIAGLLEELRSVVVEQEGDGTVVNQIHGDVSGGARVVQGRDFHGDIRL